MIWFAVAIVAHGSRIATFGVAIVRLAAIDKVPAKFRASHVPP
jgi:hypothetical protein